WLVGIRDRRCRAIDAEAIGFSCVEQRLAALEEGCVGGLGVRRRTRNADAACRSAGGCELEYVGGGCRRLESRRCCRRAADQGRGRPNAGDERNRCILRREAEQIARIEYYLAGDWC